MRPFVLHLQSTIDKLSPYYVMRFNVSTINFGPCQHGFWVVFRLFGIKFRLFYNLFSDVKRMSNGCQTILNPFSCQSHSNQPYTNVGYSNLIYITYENNIKVVKQPFLKNSGNLLANQWHWLLKCPKKCPKCLNKYPNYPKSVLRHDEPRCPKQSPSLIINSACLPMS